MIHGVCLRMGIAEKLVFKTCMVTYMKLLIGGALRGSAAGWKERLSAYTVSKKPEFEYRQNYAAE